MYHCVFDGMQSHQQAQITFLQAVGPFIGLSSDHVLFHQINTSDVAYTE